MDYEVIDEKKCISLSTLAHEAFPDLAKITAERKASKNFKAICETHNIKLEKYKPQKSKSYKIPEREKKRWLLGIRHIDFALCRELKREQTISLVEDVIDMKSALDQSLVVDIERDFKKNLKKSDFVKINDLYYKGGDISKEIAKYHFFSLEDQIEEDLEYILENAKDDEVAGHAEEYVREVMNRVGFMRDVTRERIDEENKRESE